MIGCTIDDNYITQLLDQLQYIENLCLCGDFSYFSFDSFVNLKLLSLEGTINESFNMEIFKNLCYQLEGLKINLTNIDDKTFFKLFNCHNFSNLQKLSIVKCNLSILKKEFISRFPMLSELFIIGCNLEVIEHDVFSNLKQLFCLDLSQNKLKFIEKDTFSNLEKLQTLDLSKNQSSNFEFINVSNSVEIILENKAFETYKRYWYSK